LETLLSGITELNDGGGASPAVLVR
jgi:hypothetical protein